MHSTEKDALGECKFGCIAPIECEGGMPGCTYTEAHDHGFACDKTCVYCHGKGVPIYDPENHPNHREWRATSPGVTNA